MTDREFWQQFYRHLKGMADAVKEMLDHEKSSMLGFIVPGNVIDELGIDAIDKLNDIVLQEAGHHSGDCEEVAGRG